MHTVTLKLVTIIAEPVLEERLTRALHALGARGWTITACRGEGSRGMRVGEVPGDGIRIESVVSAPVADRILELAAREYFPHYAVIAWLTDVHVVRGDKYV
jgi:nitrogen regulatory protein PII